MMLLLIHYYSYLLTVVLSSMIIKKTSKPTKKGTISFENDYRILINQENPEVFCEWVFYSEERFIKFVNPKDFKDADWKVFEHTLVQIVADEATEVVVKAAMLTIHPLKMNYALSTYNLFMNVYIKQWLVNKYKLMNSKSKMNYCARARFIAYYGFASTMKSNLICGTNIMTGSNSYIQLRRTMWKFQIDLNRGNMDYHRCIIQLQTYLPECLWATGAKEGLPISQPPWPTRELLAIVWFWHLIFLWEWVRISVRKKSCGR